MYLVVPSFTHFYIVLEQLETVHGKRTSNLFYLFYLVLHNFT